MTCSAFLYLSTVFCLFLRSSLHAIIVIKARLKWHYHIKDDAGHFMRLKRQTCAECRLF